MSTKNHPQRKLSFNDIEIESYLMRGRLERARAIRRALRRLTGRHRAVHR
jgi:hypothetical protein